jgi:RNA polymerase subunit RPABC4/transcription elongation factor Spt4
MKKQQGFLLPDGRFICPECHPQAIVQRWIREYAVVEKEEQRTQKERQKTEQARRKELQRKQEAEERAQIDAEKAQTKKQEKQERQISNLMYCAACGDKMSSQAAACPHCGHPNQAAVETSEGKALRNSALLFALASLFIFPLILGAMGFLLALVNLATCRKKIEGVRVLLVCILCPILSIYVVFWLINRQ